MGVGEDGLQEAVQEINATATLVEGILVAEEERALPEARGGQGRAQGWEGL